MWSDIDGCANFYLSHTHVEEAAAKSYCDLDVAGRRQRCRAQPIWNATFGPLVTCDETVLTGVGQLVWPLVRRLLVDRHLHTQFCLEKKAVVKGRAQDRLRVRDTVLS